LDYLKKSIELCERVGDIYHKACGMMALGHVYVSKGYYDMALNIEL
jgi:hypothetical protein